MNGDDVMKIRCNQIGKMIHISSETAVIFGEWEMGVEMPTGKGNTGGLNCIVTQLSPSVLRRLLQGLPNVPKLWDAHIPSIELYSVSLAFCIL